MAAADVPSAVSLNYVLQFPLRRENPMRTERLSRIFHELVDDDLAATHIEYALIGGFMGVLLMGGLLSLEDGLTTFYTGLAGILAAILS